MDAKAYNKEYTSVTWETCTLRKWLNGDFLKEAFTMEEQNAILTTKVDNSKSQGYSGYSADGGKNTQDQIFLLSYHEVFDQYFKENDARKCAPTEYAKARGAYSSNNIKIDGRNAGWWWLRSPGSFQNYAAGVYYDGKRNCYNVYYASVCVRPAFWIDLESELF